MRVRISFILGLVITGVFLLSCNSTDKTATSTSTASASPSGVNGQIPTVNADGVRRVTTVELKDLLAKNQAVVIDVRNDASYAAGHITGAKLIPLADIVKHANELPKDKLIVTYCS